MDRNVDAQNLCVSIIQVALRKESVDRNFSSCLSCIGSVSSLSARRAWIEIEFPKLYKALAHGRSPQGERG